MIRAHGRCEGRSGGPGRADPERPAPGRCRRPGRHGAGHRSRLGRGELGGMTLDRTRAIGAAVGVLIDLQARWHGAELDRRRSANCRETGHNRTPVLWTTRHGTVEYRPTDGGRPAPGTWTQHLGAWTFDGRAWTCPKTTCCDAIMQRTTTSCGLGLDHHPRATYCEQVVPSPGGPRNNPGAGRRTRRDGPRGNRHPDDPTDGPAATRHPIP